MDINHKKRSINSANERFNGTLTSKSFATYSALKNPQKRINPSKLLLFFIVAVLLISSGVVFITSIKTAYFQKDSDSDSAPDNISTIKIFYSDSKYIKVENITNEVSKLFNIPSGIKIVDINNDIPVLACLQVNDIIVQVSGKDVRRIDDVDTIIAQLEEDEPVIYTVYRDGAYESISPFEDTVQQ